MSIENEKEQQDIESLVNLERDKFKDSEIWLNARRLNTTTFMWTSGKSLKYENWAAGEPNNHHGNEDCLCYESSDRFWRHKWNDDICSLKKIVICQKEILNHCHCQKDDIVKEESSDKSNLILILNEFKALKVNLEHSIKSISSDMINFKNEFKVNFQNQESKCSERLMNAINANDLKLESIEGNLEITKLTLIENGRSVINQLKSGLNQHFREVWDKFDSLIQSLKSY